MLLGPCWTSPFFGLCSNSQTFSSGPCLTFLKPPRPCLIYQVFGLCLISLMLVDLWAILCLLREMLLLDLHTIRIVSLKDLLCFGLVPDAYSSVKINYLALYS